MSRTKKIAIFVEGKTERIFVSKYLSELLGGEQEFSLVVEENCGKNGTKIIATREYPDARFFVLIFDVTGDGNMLSAVLERSESLFINSGYCYIIGLQDLYPRPRSKKHFILDFFNDNLSKFEFNDRIELVLAIMEIEAWFLIDSSFFVKIDPILTEEYIKNELGVDLEKTNPESHKHPASIINKVLKLVGGRYKKNEDQSYQIVNRIDFDFMYSEEQRQRVGSWHYFVDTIGQVFGDS